VYYVQPTHWVNLSQKRSASLQSLDGEEIVLPETPFATKRVKLVSESPVAIT
jgi:hypothetical protein